jgi:Cdc6-like AAA superfamily ATPase
MMIIGASNTIDLILNLNNQYKVCPDIKNLVFEPYDFEQVFAILKERVYDTFGSDGPGHIFEEDALRFCAKKIHSLRGGDIRSVLDVMRKVYVEKTAAIESGKLPKGSTISIDEINKVEIE